MTPGHAKQLAGQVRSLDREIAALKESAARSGWTVNAGILVVKLTHRKLDALEQIEDYLTAKERAEAREKERIAHVIASH